MTEELYWLLLFTAPNILSWFVAIFFCLTRRRDNPKGAAYLGLAVLVSLTMAVVLCTYVFFHGIPGVPVSWDPITIQYIVLAFHAMTAIGFWILIIMAVFARPKHYDYIDSSMFDEDSVR